MDQKIITASGLKEINVIYNRKSNKTLANIVYRDSDNGEDLVFEKDINELSEISIKILDIEADGYKFVSLEMGIETLMRAIDIVKNQDNKHKPLREAQEISFKISKNKRVYVYNDFENKDYKPKIYLSLDEIDNKGEWEFAVFHELGHVMQEDTSLHDLYDSKDIYNFNQEYHYNKVLAYMLLPAIALIDILLLVFSVAEKSVPIFSPGWKIVIVLFLLSQCIVILTYCFFSWKYEDSFGMINQLRNYSKEYFADRFAYQYMDKNFLKDTFLYKKSFLNGKAYTHPSHQERIESLENGVAKLQIYTVVFHELAIVCDDIWIYVKKYALKGKSCLCKNVKRRVII